jgi:hypothetical protein
MSNVADHPDVRREFPAIVQSLQRNDARPGSEHAPLDARRTGDCHSTFSASFRNSGTEEVPSATNPYPNPIRSDRGSYRRHRRPPSGPYLFGTEAACFIYQPKREFQLHIPVLLEMRHRNRQERNGFLVSVPRLPQAGPNVGSVIAGRRLTNVNAISGNPMKMLCPCLRGGAAG